MDFAKFRKYSAIVINHDMDDGSMLLIYTVEPLFNEPLDITNNIFQPGKSNSKIYGMCNEQYFLARQK